MGTLTEMVLLQRTEQIKKLTLTFNIELAPFQKEAELLSMNP